MIEYDKATGDLKIEGLVFVQADSNQTVINFPKSPPFTVKHVTVKDNEFYQGYMIVGVPRAYRILAKLGLVPRANKLLIPTDKEN